MIYAFSALFLLLGMTTGIPAFFQWRRMENIKRSSGTTLGVVRSVGNSGGWNFLGEMGRSARPLVAFQVRDKEFEVQMTDNSGFLNRRYQTGSTVVVVYDKEMPWDAYLQLEWTLTHRDLWKAAAEIILAVVLWEAGLYFGLPF
jgi:hypothetical protein